MSLKSIRDSYSKLLTAFSDAGVKLTESQKNDVDSFVMAIESTMSRQRQEAIRQTKKAVEAKMEKEYRQVFESIMANMQRNAELAAAIQSKAARIDESKKIASHVDNFLDLYVEQVLPKKTIIDYDRMAKLEKIHESLKDALLVTEGAVEDKIQKLEESYKIKQSKCETQVAKVRAELNESMKTAQQLKARLAKVEAKELLESKVKDLPSYEAKKVKKQLKEATAPEIEKKFEKTLESVRKTMKLDVQEADEVIENEIDKILDSDVDEDDMLKNRKHNLHHDVSENENVEEDDMLKNRKHNLHKDVVNEDDDVDEDDMLKNRKHNLHVDEDDEPFETLDTVKENEDGDIELDESDIIDSDLMRIWCNQSQELT